MVEVCCHSLIGEDCVGTTGALPPSTGTIWVWMVSVGIGDHFAVLAGGMLPTLPATRLT